MVDLKLVKYCRRDIKISGMVDSYLPESNASLTILELQYNLTATVKYTQTIEKCAKNATRGRNLKLLFFCL